MWLALFCKVYIIHDCVYTSSLSRIWFFVTLWTIAQQAPLAMEFFRQEYWSGLPCPSPGESSRPRDLTWISCTAGGFFTYWAIRCQLGNIIKENKAQWDDKGAVGWGSIILDILGKRSDI